MGERTSYTPGTFCWGDLGTSDAAGAKAFYSALFGWESEDFEGGPTGTYTMLRVDGGVAGGLYQAGEGAHPAWLSYVSVEDAGAGVSRLRELGGKVMSEPFDVGPPGRMAVVQDPQGAVFALWQAAGSAGAERVNAPGALSLNQLNTSDPEAARTFYTELFGWKFEAVAEGDTPYWGIYNDGNLNGGMMPLPPAGGAPPHWLTYFGSADIDADAGRVAQLEGRLLVPPMPVPGGHILVAQDPQGAVFGLVAGRFDD